mmetsp:Transcript_15729/g.49232  ORF Transcript_15729/g.49232 Transcript_15729/m.49232 type:complete len:154 (+) Transcript_15729:26-487(+)
MAVPTASHVQESTIVNGSHWTVWGLIRSMKFEWCGEVVSATSDSEALTVGTVMTYTYADGTTQSVQIVELSDLLRFVTYQMVASTPAVSYTSALFKIQVYEVTVPVGAEAQSYVEWTTDYSNDADAAVIVDSRFKKHEAFKALAAALTVKGGN